MLTVWLMTQSSILKHVTPLFTLMILSVRLLFMTKKYLIHENIMLLMLCLNQSSRLTATTAFLTMISFSLRMIYWAFLTLRGVADLTVNQAVWWKDMLYFIWEGSKSKKTTKVKSFKRELLCCVMLLWKNKKSTYKIKKIRDKEMKNAVISDEKSIFSSSLLMKKVELILDCTL